MNLTYIRRLLLLLPFAVLALGCSSDGDSGNDDPAPTANPNQDLLGNIPALTTSVNDGQGSTYSVGYDQVSGNNQDAWVRKVTNGNQVYKRFISSVTTADERADKIYRDSNGNIWVIASVDGGSSDNAYFNRAGAANSFSGVPFSDYGQSGGPRVGILMRIDPATGQVLKGTFLRARLSNGNTNSLTINSLTMGSNGKLWLDITSASTPPAAGSTGSNFRNHPDAQDANRIDGFFQLRMELPTSLASIDRSVLRKPN